MENRGKYNVFLCAVFCRRDCLIYEAQISFTTRTTCWCQMQKPAGRVNNWFFFPFLFFKLFYPLLRLSAVLNLLYPLFWLRSFIYFSLLTFFFFFLQNMLCLRGSSKILMFSFSFSNRYVPLTRHIVSKRSHDQVSLENDLRWIVSANNNEYFCFCALLYCAHHT